VLATFARNLHKSQQWSIISVFLYVCVFMCVFVCVYIPLVDVSVASPCKKESRVGQYLRTQPDTTYFLGSNTQFSTKLGTGRRACWFAQWSIVSRLDSQHQGCK